MRENFTKCTDRQNVEQVYKPSAAPCLVACPTFWLGALTSKCICSCSCCCVVNTWVNRERGKGNGNGERVATKGKTDALLWPGGLNAWIVELPELPELKELEELGKLASWQTDRLADWRTGGLAVSATENEKLHVAGAAAIVVYNCFGYFTLTIDGNDALQI